MWYIHTLKYDSAIKKKKIGVLIHAVVCETSKRLCSVKEARHYRLHIVCFHLHELSITGEAIDKEDR